MTTFIKHPTAISAGRDSVPHSRGEGHDLLVRELQQSADSCWKIPRCTWHQCHTEKHRKTTMRMFGSKWLLQKRSKYGTSFRTKTHVKTLTLTLSTNAAFWHHLWAFPSKSQTQNMICQKMRIQSHLSPFVSKSKNYGGSNCSTPLDMPESQGRGVLGS